MCANPARKVACGSVPLTTFIKARKMSKILSFSALSSSKSKLLISLICDAPLRCVPAARRAVAAGFNAVFRHQALSAPILSINVVAMLLRSEVAMTRRLGVEVAEFPP